MGQKQLSEEMKQRYEACFKEIEEALGENVELTLTSFCQGKSIEVRSFTSWMSVHKNITPRELRNRVRTSKGMSPIKPRGQLEYDKHLDAYKKLLAIDLDYPISQYCEDVGMSQNGFTHWLSRHNLNIYKVKQSVCTELGIEPTKIKDTAFCKPQPSEPAMFRRAMEGYRKTLEKDLKVTLRQFCRTKGYAYHPLLAWMREIGIKPADIKAIVAKGNKLPRDNRHVFIQFKPNGGTSGNLMKDVRISLPDGTLIEVGSCTVVGLCSFVNIYSKN